MADCEIPLAAASFLKSLSHASKLPVPQDAACTGAPVVIRTALTAKALNTKPGVIGTNQLRKKSPVKKYCPRQHEMSGATTAKTRPVGRDGSARFRHAGGTRVRLCRLRKLACIQH